MNRRPFDDEDEDSRLALSRYSTPRKRCATTGASASRPCTCRGSRSRSARNGSATTAASFWPRCAGRGRVYSSLAAACAATGLWPSRPCAAISNALEHVLGAEADGGGECGGGECGGGEDAAQALPADMRALYLLSSSSGALQRDESEEHGAETDDASEEEEPGQ